MILSRIFGKSKPVNLLFFGMILLVWFATAFFLNQTESHNWKDYTQWVGVFAVLLVSIFIVDFIISKNALTGKNSYALFLYTLFLGFFPSIFIDLRLVLANFFLILAFRRFISLGNGKRIPQRIFDGCLWVAVACLFYEWSLVFFLVVYVAIFRFKLSGYRNFLIPLVAIGLVLFLYFTFCFSTGQLSLFWDSFQFNIDIQGKYKHWQYVFPMLFLLVIGAFSLVFFFLKNKKRTGIMQAKHSLVIIIFLVAIVTAFPAEGENGSELLWIFFPGAIMAGSWLEMIKKKAVREAILIICAFVPLLLLVLNFTTKS